jgi:DNA-binding transcriptional LysR family regulator
MESLALAAQSEVGGSEAAISGAVRIGAPEGFGSYFLAPRMGALCDLHPELEVQLVAIAGVFSLSKREADLAITLSAPREGRLVARKLTDYSLGLYAAPAYLASRAEIASPEDLKGCRGIGYIEDLLYAPELDYLDQSSVELSVRFKSSNLIAQLRAALAGAGLCILPDFIAHADPRLRPVLRDRIRLERSFWLVTHADVKNLARIRATADFLVDEVRKSRPVFLP